MINRSLKITTLCVAVSAAVAGCDGPGEGYSNPLVSESAVSFSNAGINAAFDEESGVQQVDLLEGAMVDGQQLTQSDDSPVYIRGIDFTPQNANFQTPSGAGGSPFKLSSDGVHLEIDTGMFAQALRMCDTTDVRGATDADGNPTGDGVRDFPTSIGYEVTYSIDNGYDPGPGQALDTRTLNLTINAISDPVTGVQAFDVSLPATAATPMLSATAPAFACNPALTYEIADTGTATVDADGMISGLQIGTTTITVTSVEDPTLSATATVSVTPAFTLAITNQDFNALGAPLGTKSVPTCSAIGVAVEPSVVNDALTGEYTYSWSSDNPSALYGGEESDGAFGATGRFSNALGVSEPATVTVGYGNGYTGVTDPLDIEDQTVLLTAVRNHACDPNASPHPAGYVTDLGLNTGRWGPLATAVPGGGLDGAASVLITAPGGDITTVVQQVWNQNRNFHSQYYGRGAASTGRTFKFSVWARLGQVPSGDDVVLDHTLLPWACTTCGGSGFPGRRPQSESVTATLKPTTGWQLVEFINPLTGTPEWSVPAIWDLNTAMFLHWDVYGLAAGETIEIDSYSVVEVTP